MTRAGPLDILGTIGAERGYEDLLPHATELEVAGMRLRVLDLDTLIQVKEETGHPKDKAVLPILRETFLEKRRRGD